MNVSQRKQLLDLNIQAWNGQYQLPLTSNLDSSLKKNSAFVRKLKAPFQDGEKMANEVKSLSLEKYLSEIVDNLIEGFSLTARASDVYATVELVSALHQRFQASFTEALVARLLFCICDQGTINPDSKTEIIFSKLTVLRRLMRIFTELYLVGLFMNESSLRNSEVPFLLESPDNKSLMNTLLEQTLMFFLNESIIKHNLSFVAAYVKRFSWVFFEPNSLLSSTTQTKLKDEIEKYTMKAISLCEKLDRSLNKLLVTSDRTAMKTGRENQRDKSSISDQIHTLRQMKSSLEELTTMMGLEMPSCSALDANDKTSTSGIILTSSHHYWVFEDESDRRFYEMFPEPFADPYSSEDSLSSSEKSARPGLESRAERMQKLLEKLDRCKSASDVDSLAIVYFQEGLQCKASDKHLMRHMLANSNQHPVKYYSRFLTISQPLLKSIKDEIVDCLDKKLRIQLSSAKFNLKDIVFFCELIKFKIVPTFIIFHKIRTLIISLESRSKYFEILSIIFDNCGRVLTRDKEYRIMMDEMVELIQELSCSGTRSFQLRSQINDLLMILYPPKVSQRDEIVKETVNTCFLKQVLRVELNLDSIGLIKRILASINFESSESFCTVEQLFTQPESLPSDSLQLVAELLQTSFPRWFVASTIDKIMERVSIGLEDNNYKMSHKRLADMRYLAELCNTGFFNDHLVYFVVNLLNYILFFGYSDLTLKTMRNSSLDPPNNYIRILMITTFLKHCMRSVHLVKSEGERLDYFLCHFDYYCSNKGSLPHDIRLAILDVYQILGFTGCLKIEQGLIKLENVRGNVLRAKHTPGTLEDEEQVKLTPSDTDHLKVASALEQCQSSDEQLLEEFEQRFKETMEQTKFDRSIHKTNLPAALPRVTRHSDIPNVTKENSNVKFKILSRKDKKTASSEIQVPHDALFASEALRFVSQRRREDDRIRKFILNRMKDTSLQ
ncbi:BA75_04371T0 [Komagataella pastoris]|uniref:BA75_04371T0 n=1 Tax=Komagataella pastoris TaxID=4922 RepID=A0A1B2JI53_PICPA|nr:BA75_04371T0 [Komagataella pastoris]